MALSDVKLCPSLPCPMLAAGKLQNPGVCLYAFSYEVSGVWLCIYDSN